MRPGNANQEIGVPRIQSVRFAPIVRFYPLTIYVDSVELFLFCGGLLFRQFGKECLLPLGHITLVSFRINEWVGPALFHSRKLLFHSVVISVSAQKYIRRQ